ncbi:MAG: anthranilate phosphoribosyltransferase [Alistipes sp.]|nr:anthranilate phosphoribosyltransferase [Alistipes sp.]
MKNILYRLFEHSELDRSEARDVLIRMARGEFNESQIAAFITVFLMRSITLDELSGFRDALLEMRVPVDLGDYDAIDIVGTGGDNKNTFNISTAACFTVAGAGYKVVKHGNYGATSVSGASNVIEHHGVKFTTDTDLLRRSLDECNIAYLHAQFFNPALKAVGPVRKALGVRTFFNMLGPLVNPVIPKRQLLGVYNLKLARLYSYMYQQGDTRFTIVNSLDGYDEISLTSDFKYMDNNGEGILTPEELGFPRAGQEELHGGETVAEAARIFDNVLNGTATPAQENAVVANAAFAIRNFEPALPIADCIGKARESIRSGRAAAAFAKFTGINAG